MRKFAVFGDPIAHSISPRLHNLAISALNLDAFYGRVHLTDAKKLESTFNALNLSGANITVPHKEVAFEICDQIDDYAQNIGSINTIVKRDEKFLGFNTDAPGFMRSVAKFGEINSALIIGAGGTARALAFALKKSGIKVQIVNRSAQKAQNFIGYDFFDWSNFSPNSYDLVINSTSAGLKDENLPLPKEILSEVFSASKFAFDVIYGRNTPFLELAEHFSLATKDGSEMLLNQAVLAFDKFFDGKFDLKIVENAMKIAFTL